MHTGHFEQFGQAYEAIVRWIVGNNYEQTGPFREVYHKFDRHDVRDVVVEIQFPVRKR
jgi:effector-binding domain-containing protein